MNKDNLGANLPYLQNLIKKDKVSHKDDWDKQFKICKDEFEVLSGNEKPPKKLTDLIMFIAQTCKCYKEHVEEFSNLIVKTLDDSVSGADKLNPDFRMVLIRALILLRNQRLIQPKPVYDMFFKLFKCKSKLLRSTMYTFIVEDIKNANRGRQNPTLNKKIQNDMYARMTQADSTCVDMCLRVMVDLYKKRIWNNAKTVDVIRSAWFSKFAKVKTTALRFFLGNDEPAEQEDSDDEAGGPSARDIIMRFAANKKTQKAKLKREKALKLLRKSKKRNKKQQNEDFSAIQLLNDPQSNADQLFSQLSNRSNKESFETRLLMIIVIARLIGIHKLQLEEFYPFLQPLLKPHQSEVTKILNALAQATHDQVAPDLLTSVVRVIADEFVSERNSSDVMAVGLQAIREICNRNPHAINPALLQDLTCYKTKQQKSVMAASRSLLQLYRKINPEMLKRKDRGRPSEAGRELVELHYGRPVVYNSVPNSDVLPTCSELQEDAEDGEEDWEEECVAHDYDSDDNEGWIDVSSEGENDNEEKELPEPTEEEIEEKKTRAQMNSVGRIFSTKEHQEMRAQAALKHVTYGKKNKKVKRVYNPDEGFTNTELVAVENIERVMKCGQSTKAEKMALVLAGREDRTFGRKRQKLDPFASTTNKQKVKNKQYMMVRHKAIKKQSGRSFREKQIELRKALTKQKTKGYKY